MKPRSIRSPIYALGLSLSLAIAPLARAIEPGETSGQLDTSSATLQDGSYYAPHDIPVEAGDGLAIDLVSDEFDPYLLLLDPDGNQIASDDDSGLGDDARILLTAPQSGIYRIFANTYSAGETGGYVLRWSEATPDEVAQYDASNEFERGIALYDRGQYQASVQPFETALVMLQEIGDRAAESRLRSYLGMSYYFLGNLSGSLSMLQESVAIAEAEGNTSQLLTSRLNLASIYNALGRYEDSLESNRETRELAQAAGDRFVEAAAAGNMALIHRRLGEYDRAIVLHREAHDLFQAIGETRDAAYALSNLSLVYQQTGRYVEAVEVGRELLVLFEEIGDRRGQGLVLGNLSAAHNNLNEFDAAIEASKQAIAIFREIDDRRELAFALHNIGSVYQQTDELDKAETVLYEAIELLDAMRSPDLSDSDRVSLFETQLGSFELLQDILLRQGKWSQTLEVTERSRARAFIHLLDRQLQQDTAALEPQPPTVADMRAIAREQNATLVQYLQIRNYIVAWVIHPDGQIFGEAIPLDDLETSLDGLIMASRCPTARCEHRVLSDMRGSGTFDPAVTRDAFSDFDRGEIAEPSGLQQQLHEILIDPIAEHLPTDPDETVIFIPDGSLFLVAFPALQDSAGTHLIEKHTMSIAPAIEVLGKTRQLAERRTENDAILIVGNPTMPAGLTPLAGAQDEGEQIADLWSTVMLTANEATETRIVEQMPEARVIHLATHGIFDEDAGLSSAIALAPSGEDDGWLTAVEILDLSLNADLVALSACSTGLGKISGDGVIGLSRSLMVSGVPSVLVSLWNVNDRATTDLMVEFYKAWQGSGLTKAQALRQAMLAVKEQYPNPYYWAAFALIGEPE